MTNLINSESILLVQWLEGYGNEKPQVIHLKDMVDNVEWGLDSEFLTILEDMQEGKIYDYHDPSGVVRFQKAIRG